MIRPATLDDRAHFLRLWAQFLEEQRKAGSHILPTLPNLYRCLNVFERYTRGDQYGVCLFWEPEGGEPVGMTMGGSDIEPNQWETDLGELCTLWGVYVDPSHRKEGIANKLTEAIFQRALEWGADHFETYILNNNAGSQKLIAGADSTPHISRYIVSFRDAKEFRETQ